MPATVRTPRITIVNNNPTIPTMVTDKEAESTISIMTTHLLKASATTRVVRNRPKISSIPATARAINHNLKINNTRDIKDTNMTTVQVQPIEEIRLR